MDRIGKVGREVMKKLDYQLDSKTCSFLTKLSFCFGALITLFHCSIPVQGSQVIITSEKLLKRGLFVHTSHRRPSTTRYTDSVDGPHGLQTWLDQHISLGC